MKNLKIDSLKVFGMIMIIGLLFVGCPNPSGGGNDTPVNDTPINNGNNPPSDAVTYTVTFDSNGGSAVDAIQVQSGNTITLPAEPSKGTSTFAGWFTDNNSFANAFTSASAVTANITVYAKWFDVPVNTVTFDSNGGSEVDDVIAESGKTITLPAEPTRTGHKFIGWFTDNNSFANAFTASTTVSIDITVYAKWEINVYSVKFDSNGGSAVQSPISVNHGETISLPAEPSNGIHVLFGGWYTDNNTFQNEFTASTAVNGSFTVYAKWRAYAIGETGPAGGYIFYDNGTIHADGWRYLEAAPESTETGAQWGSKSHDIDADGTAIGTGQANTNLIVAALTTLGETGRAAQICDALEFGGYNDWFLPSQDELKEMYEHKTSAMGYSSSPYWSSTEGYAGYAFNLMFAYGSLSQVEKDRSGRVRAARRF